jgi:hypothetical protein
MNAKIRFITATPKNPEEVTLTKAVVMEDDTSEKRKATMYRIETFDNIELLFQTLIEFQDVSKPSRLNLISENEQTDVFRECLRDPIREAYDIARTTIMNDNEPFTFARVISLWISGHLTADDYQRQLAHVRRIVKPFKVNGEAIDVHFFHQRMQVILARMVYFPSAPNTREAIMTAEEYNYILFYAMPPAWQQKYYEKTNISFSQIPVKDLISHFQVLWEADQSNKIKYDEKVDTFSTDRKRGYQGDHNSNRNKRHRGRNGNNKPASNNNNNNRNRMDPSKNGNHNPKSAKNNGCKYQRRARMGRLFW